MPSLTAELTNKKPIVLLLCITAVVFFNSLFNGYALDDELYALNPAISEPSFALFSEIFSSGTFHDKGPEGYDYRPLSLSSFVFEYHVFGKHVGLSHAINLLLYLLILVQFYKLLLKLGMDAKLALMAMLLFALHPIHTEVINNLKCRDELLMFVFALSSFHFALNYFFDQRPIRLLYVFLFMFLAFLSK